MTRKGKPTIGLLRFVVFLPLVIIVSFIANGIILDEIYMLSLTLERKASGKKKWKRWGAQITIYLLSLPIISLLFSSVCFEIIHYRLVDV